MTITLLHGTYRIVLGILFLFAFSLSTLNAQQAIHPSNIKFIRQGVQRLIFDSQQAILLAKLDPSSIVGLSSMHPQTIYSADTAKLSIHKGLLRVASPQYTETSIWLGACNPFATYSAQVEAPKGKGAIGFEFANSGNTDRFQVVMNFKDGQYKDVVLKIVLNKIIVHEQSIVTTPIPSINGPIELILQMFGSGLNVYIQESGLPISIAQADFSQLLDLRRIEVMHSFQSRLVCVLDKGEISISHARSALTTGVGQADIRAITHKDGSPYLDKGRLWYTLSIRGRGLDHHLQGVFSLNPSAFDLKLEGIIVFDRDDGLLRNEISSHIFYDDDAKMWRGFTTGFSFAANPQKEQKQIWFIESKVDPRFGFSIMKAKPTNMVGDIEDSHIIYDTRVNKWRLLTCENTGGYKAILLESDTWNGIYKRIAGPVQANSTGTSLQQIGNTWYCFSGSSERKIFIYTYPDLQPAGILQIDLPPWDDKAGSRVWPNIIQLPDGYATKYIALMMDRYNYPGLKGPNWTYGALYLYYGY
ncbi:hypothetical protein GXP67_35915 [Rhodocytophaga rosea]|uniref:Uncharacterized protein n=1 Tax=Rhodocytophaga rosea TaxID=2704465 RepID=A0A6C0GUF1_9BACT|nr:hypothetical protein [Rhodocytophaga rosea]QHT71676.1 hypothetical protein GXP67_35915 [Rhodocytophaga rosea]